MRLALVDGHRCAPGPGISGLCPSCGSPVIPKCGTLRAWHWAHLGVRRCDPWWEGETDWHIGWKNRFPVEWQEIIQRAEDGEKHVADVRAPDGRVVEFQHSPLATEERRARESFYGKMVWVVDGLARKRDHRSFEQTRYLIQRDPLVYSGHPVECALLRDWVHRPVDVFFDFGMRAEDIARFGRAVLWHLIPNPERRVLLEPVSTDFFVAALHEAIPFRRLRTKPSAQRPPTKPLVARPRAHSPRRRRRAKSFQEYLSLRRRERSRQRF